MVSSIAPSNLKVIDVSAAASAVVDFTFIPVVFISFPLGVNLF